MSLPMLSRRTVLSSVAALAASLPVAGAGPAADQLRALESRFGGRLGVAALDTGSDRRVDYHSSSLWPMCSTFKLLLVGAVLAKVDQGIEQIDRALPIAAADLPDYAPVVKAKIGRGHLSVAELCEAAICVSDNAAANLLLQTVGGPGGLTIFARGLGDRTSHFDRIEPYVNEAAPGDARDTTSPAAMLGDLGALLLGGVLTLPSRQTLINWLLAATTGGDRLRAGLPKDWRVGDKSGSGGHGAANDVAIAWPPGRPPLLIAAFYTDNEASPTERNALLAEVGRVVARELVAGA
jgi:beta-lactamase class A